MATKETRVWIRRDNETGALEEVPEEKVKSLARMAYRNPVQAMQAASEKAPLCNAFACYWPKTEVVS